MKCGHGVVPGKTTRVKPAAAARGKQAAADLRWGYLM